MTTLDEFPGTPEPDPVTQDHGRIIDNQREDVQTVINNAADSAEEIRIGVGYFFVSGFELIKDHIQEASRIQLLIGSDTSKRTINELKRGFSDTLDEIPREDAKDGVRCLHELIQEDRVEVRVFSDRVFHSKAYLFKPDPDNPSSWSAVYGSANLSKGGLRDNDELTTLTRHTSFVTEIDEWFESRWGAAEEYDTDIMSTELERTKFRPDLDIRPSPSPQQADTPTNTVDSDVNGQSDELLPDTVAKRFVTARFREDIEAGYFLNSNRAECTDELTEFQKDAYQAAKEPLNKYGGVILADSVGLGKSYIGAPLVQDYTSPTDHVLIVAPKHLRDMWVDTYLDQDVGLFPVSAEVTFLSFSAVSRLPDAAIQAYRSVDLVLIDEVHNLRNNTTLQYGKLQSIGQEGKQFVTLTATPVQNSIHDVENVINLFATDRDFTRNGCQVTPSTVFSKYSHLSRTDRNNRSPEEQQEYERLCEQVEDILGRVVIARDWKYINETYENPSLNGHAIEKATRVPNLVTPDYDGIEDLYEAIVETVVGKNGTSGLNLPHINTTRYATDSDGSTESNEADYRGATALRVVQLLKRLESSYAAFAESIDQLIHQERIIRKLITGELASPEERSAAVDAVDAEMYGDFAQSTDFDDITATVNELTDTQRQVVLRDIDEDLAALQELKDAAVRVFHETVDANVDGQGPSAKVNDLETILKGQPHEKVLVFSQYVPTIESVFEQTTGCDAGETQVGAVETVTGERTVAYVHGSGAFDSKIVERFAPDAQNADVAAEDEIDILLTSDILSEGHNIEDARVLVNFDLRWNPMHLEQRIGRVDRITSPYDEVYIYNFVPTTELEDRLGLLNTLKSKLSEISDTFGQTAPILDRTEEEISKSITSHELLESGETPEDNNNGVEVSESGATRHDMRTVAQEFCEERNITTDELHATINTLETQDDPVFFAVPGRDYKYEGVIVIAELTYSNGDTEWRSIVFNTGVVDLTMQHKQAAFTKFPKLKDGDVPVFNELATDPGETPTLTDDARETVEGYVSDLQDPGVWNTDILQVDTTAQTVEQFRSTCESVVSRDRDDEAVRKAEELIEAFDTYEITPWLQRELNTWHRKRNAKSVEYSVHKMHALITDRSELAEPKVVEEVAIRFAGYRPAE